MKLYTEEQVREAILIAVDIIASEKTWTLDDVIDKVNSIELPSDEEIEEIIKPFEFEYTKIGFRACARWIKNKIQGGNK